MNFKKIVLTLSGISLLAGMSYFLAKPALAYKGDPSVQGPNCTEEQNQQMTQAFENNDYQAWKNTFQGKGKISEAINEENFSKFVEMRKLRLEGKIDEANQIREELGLGLGSGNQYGNQSGSGRWSK